MKRIDSRKANEVRSMKCEIGVCNKADGSAYLHQGSTKVLALVYGPHEVRSGKDYKAVNTGGLVYCQFSRMISNRAQSREGADVRAAQQIRQAFESTIITSLYPRTQIDIFIKVLQSAGSDVSASINVASLALVDAGIQMKGVVCSCSCAEINGALVLDPSWDEEAVSSQQEVFALLPFTNQIVMMDGGQVVVGRGGVNAGSCGHENQQEELMEVIKSACKTILLHLNEAIKNHHLKNNKPKTCLQP